MLEWKNFSKEEKEQYVLRQIQAGRKPKEIAREVYVGVTRITFLHRIARMKEEKKNETSKNHDGV